MLRFFMWLEFCRWRSSVLAQVAGVSYTLMFFFICHLRLKAVVEANTHWSQGYLLPSCLDSLCDLSPDDVIAEWSHRSQGYLIPSCLDSLCFLRLSAVVALYSHWSQGYLLPSCLASLCRLRWSALAAINSHSLHWYFVFFGAFTGDDGLSAFLVSP